MRCSSIAAPRDETTRQRRRDGASRLREANHMPIQKILLVDDSKTELHHLSELLGKRGFDVRTAENGEDAMPRRGAETPDLILMDVVMPGQYGFQLTRAITRDPRFSKVPVIMCTSKNPV